MSEVRICDGDRLEYQSNTYKVLFIWGGMACVQNEETANSDMLNLRVLQSVIAKHEGRIL